uniref:Uncharacterized protein n=1 Tax=Lygus hesperus TaxID=30085 RepID=A0A0K8SHZ5_LYGHE
MEDLNSANGYQGDGSQTEAEFQEMLAGAESGEPISRLTELLKLCAVDFPVHCLALFASRRSPRSSAVRHMPRAYNIQQPFWLVPTATTNPVTSWFKREAGPPSYPPFLPSHHH